MKLAPIVAQSEWGTQESTSFSPTTWAYFGFFVVSGFCGLVYEVVWLRLAMASFGVTTALTAIVLAVFMAGLGLGSWGAGVLAGGTRARNARWHLRLYSLVEFLVGVSSLAVPYELKFGHALLERMGRFAGWQSSRYYLLSGVWIAISLVPWCSCMGATLPLLMAVIRVTRPSASERSFSYLYVANVLGALLGTVASAFVLIEMFGFRGTLTVAGALNLILGVLAFGLSLVLGASSSRPTVTAQRAVPQNPYGLGNGLILCMLFTTGMVCMGMEVIWIRQFTPYLGNVVYAFAGILAAYLFGTLVGSRDYRSWARVHAPGDSISSWSFLALFAIVPLVAADPHLEIRVLEPELGFLRLLAIFLFCALAGFLTPLLVDSWSSGDPRKAGTAYAINIIGSIAGPLLAGFWLLPFCGERRAAATLSLPLFGIAALIAFGKRAIRNDRLDSRVSSKLKFAAAAVIAVVLYSVSHDFETRYAQRRVLRDYAATTIATGEGFNRRLVVNGFSMTTLDPMTKYMAHLPMAFMSRRPQNGLVICFGMGTTFRSMLSWGVPVTAVDLVPSVPEMFEYYHSDAGKLLSDPMARIVIDDGRRFLDGTTEFYDVIVTDPPPPTAAPGSSLLYSCEFYALVRKHLRKDGILQVWYPLLENDRATGAAVAKALQESFPYVKAFPSYKPLGAHFLASMSPLPDTSSATLAARMPVPAVADFVEWGPESTAERQFDRVLSADSTVNEIIDRDPNIPAIRDDQPINEYYLLRYLFHYPR